MRLFVALDLPETYRESLVRLTDSLAGRLNSRLSWTRPENWHLTLKFLGETDQVEGVARALSKVRSPAFEMCAGTAGFFPSADAPNVVWLGICEGAESCVELARLVEQALLPLGFAAEKRPFRPHLTVARVRKQGKDDWRSVAAELSARQWPLFRVGEFLLMQSELGPEGPRYSRVKSVPLGD